MAGVEAVVLWMGDLQVDLLGELRCWERVRDGEAAMECVFGARRVGRAVDRSRCGREKGASESGFRLGKGSQVTHTQVNGS